MRTRVERINPSLDVLGFAVFVETPTLGILEADGYQIHLRKGGPDSSRARVWIGVGDIVALHELHRARKVEIVQEPTNYTWAYQTMVEDPDRNLLVFGSGPLEGEPFQGQA